MTSSSAVGVLNPGKGAAGLYLRIKVITTNPIAATKTNAEQTPMMIPILFRHQARGRASPREKPPRRRTGLGIRSLLGRLGVFRELLRGFYLGHPRGEGGVRLGELRDDGVRPPPGLPFLSELLPQVLGLLPKDLDQRSTVYLSFTSSLRPAVSSSTSSLRPVERPGSG